MTGSALAADPVKKDDSASQQEMKDENPYIKVMNDKAKKLADSLTEKEAKTLGLIRENFGFLHSVDIARKSVKEAATLCMKENSSLKKAMKTRHQSWDTKIGDILVKQEKNLHDFISKDNFSDPAQIEDYLGSIDDMAEYAENKIQKNIVTTPEACKGLIDSMDHSEEVIVRILEGMTWPDVKNSGNGEATP